MSSNTHCPNPQSYTFTHTKLLTNSLHSDNHLDLDSHTLLFHLHNPGVENSGHNTKHQIDWANEYDVNLDSSSSGLPWNGLIYLLSTPTSNLSERMANSEVCTLYDCKNQTNSYNFLRIKRVHAFLLSVSFKPIFVVIASLYAKLGLFSFSTGVMVNIIFIILHTVQTI